MVGFVLLVSGCFQLTPCGKFQFTPCDVKITPANLPYATVGQPYTTRIKIIGGTMTHEEDIKWELFTKTTWVHIQLFKDSEMHYNGMPIYRGVEINGTPEHQEEITIRVYGKSSSPCVCPFDKTFTIKVNLPNNKTISNQNQ